MDRGLADRTALYMNEAVRLAGRAAKGTRCNVEVEGAMKSLQGKAGLAVRYVVRRGKTIEGPRLAMTQYFSSTALWNELTRQIDEQFGGGQLTVLQGWTNDKLKDYLCAYASSPIEVQKFKSILRQSVTKVKNVYSTEISGVAEIAPPSQRLYYSVKHHPGIFVSKYFKLLNQLTRYNYTPERSSYSERRLSEIANRGLTGSGFFLQTNPEKRLLAQEALYSGPISGKNLGENGYVRIVVFGDTINPYKPSLYRRFITFYHWMLIDANGTVLAELRNSVGTAQQALGSRFSDNILCPGYEAFTHLDQEPNEHSTADSTRIAAGPNGQRTQIDRWCCIQLRF